MVLQSRDIGELIQGWTRETLFGECIISLEDEPHHCFCCSKMMDIKMRSTSSMHLHLGWCSKVQAYSLQEFMEILQRNQINICNCIFLLHIRTKLYSFGWQSV